MTSQFELLSIFIDKDWSDKTKYNCRIRLSNQESDITLKLDAGISAKVRALIADEMVAATQGLAMQISRDIIEGKTLPAPEEVA